MRTLFDDLRYAFRNQRMKPAFTAVAILTLALGIGANTAVFSAANALLLRPLPYREADRLMLVSEVSENRSVLPVAFPNFVDWRKQNAVFESMAAWRPNDVIYSNGYAPPERLSGRRVTAGFFGTLGVRPERGRDFREEDDKPGAANTAIVTRTFWLSRMNGDRSAIGKSVRIDGQPYTVIGIVPPTRLFGDPQIYTPLGPYAHAEERYDHNATSVIARLKAGISPEQARANMQAITRQLELQYPEANKGETVYVTPLKEWITGGSRRVMFVFLGAVGFILLIACVNVANLVLAQSAERQREFAVRAAVGAGRGRIIRQLLTESLLLGLEAGALGLLFAAAGTEALRSFVPEDIAAGGVPIDGTVLCFSFALSMLTGVLFGLAPAITVSKPDLNESLKDGRRTSSAGIGRDRFRSALVIAEVALALVLLVGAGLMIRSARSLLGVDPGFQPENLLTFHIALDEQKLLKAAGVTMEKLDADKLTRHVGPWQARLLEGLKRSPAVRHVATVFPLDVTGSTAAMEFIPAGHLGKKDLPQAFYHIVSPDYFRAMGIRLLTGRFTTERDDFAAPRVAILGESLAKKTWPGEDPIGKTFKFRFLHTQPFTVIGVVSDTKQLGLEGPTLPQMYVSHLQWPNTMAIVARTYGDPMKALPELRKIVAEWEPEMPVYDARSMEARLEEMMAGRTRSTGLLVLAGGLALVLTCVGVYSVMAYLVTRQTREIGIRMALGAGVGTVLRSVLGKALVLAGAGAAAGLAGAFALTRLISHMLYGVKASDPVAFVAGAAVLLAASAAAAAVPARKAATVDPIDALRSE